MPLAYFIFLIVKRPLQDRGVGLESLTEKIETVSTTGKLVFHVFAALAEFERNLIRERTLAGLKAARAWGRNGGRPRKLSPKELKTIRTLLRSNEVPVQDIATQFKVNRSTLYRNVTATGHDRMKHTTQEAEQLDRGDSMGLRFGADQQYLEPYDQRD